MTAKSGFILLNKVAPLICGAIGRGAVKCVGAEDREELQQDTLAIAARMIDAAEASGSGFTPGTIAFFAITAAKSGRRFGSAGRTDAMSSGAQLAGRVSLRSMDEPIGFDENDPDHEITLHDFLSDNHEDAGAQAGRRIDWDAAMATMDTRMQGVLMGTAEGTSNQELAARYNISPPRCSQVREAAAAKISEVWGGDPVVDATSESAWSKHIRTYAQRRACRSERAAQHRAAP